MGREKLPPGLPPPWMIEEIKKKERQKKERERQQPQIPLEEPPREPPREEPYEIIIDPKKKDDGWYQM